MLSERAWVVNVGVEGMNGATCSLSMGIDGPGGMVDGVGGEVNDTSGADEMGVSGDDLFSTLKTSWSLSNSNLRHLWHSLDSDHL